nr:hypothetical protein BdHM001_18450 [Bdellovibrio sp. HM001]
MTTVYPKWIYHKTQAPKIVNNEVEHEQAGEGWEETPAAFDKKSNEAPEAPTNGEGEGEQTKAPIQEKDFTKMTKPQLIAYLVEKGVDETELKKLNKDDLIAKVGEL